MAIQIPRGEHVPTADQRVVMYGLSWDDYEALLKLRGDRSMPRMVYLDGALELMTTSEDHERILAMLKALAMIYMFETGMDFGSYGHWTMKQKAPELEAAGIEADDCFRIGLDQTRGRWPDLAIEVVWTSGGLNKLEAYRRIGVREVWFWEDDEITVHVLGEHGYEQKEQSVVVPGIDLALIARFVDEPVLSKGMHAYREVFLASRSGS